jgi:hypothetical protein
MSAHRGKEADLATARPSPKMTPQRTLAMANSLTIGLSSWSATRLPTASQAPRLFSMHFESTKRCVLEANGTDSFDSSKLAVQILRCFVVHALFLRTHDRSLRDCLLRTRCLTARQSSVHARDEDISALSSDDIAIAFRKRPTLLKRCPVLGNYREKTRDRGLPGSVPTASRSVTYFGAQSFRSTEPVLHLR